MAEILFQILIYLGAAVIAVPLAARLGLGSVLGYLAAGIAIGPILGLVGSETKDVQHVAEFGIVMMLFLIGLSLNPRALWDMRHRLLGLGGLQLVLTTVGVMLGAIALGYPAATGLVIGLILALSSTAIVLQTLSERGLIKSRGGRSIFAVLLTQDIAVIPILALLPLLTVQQQLFLHGESPDILQEPTAITPHGQSVENGLGLTVLDGLPGWGVTLATLSIVAAIILAGVYFIRPIFRFIHATGLREMYTALALLIVIGISVLMTIVGLSPALGAFLAGVVLANSEFRHELESDIEPFKGLLLGLFFITVGAGMNLSVLQHDPIGLLTLAVLIIIAKGCVLYLLCHLFGIQGRDRWLFTLGLAQAGEFGFVLTAFAVQHNILSVTLSDRLVLIITLTMLMTPLLFLAFEALSRRLKDKIDIGIEDEINEQGPVIIAGIGRFGQIVNRLVQSSGFETVVLDHDIRKIDLMRSFGIKSFLGDPTRPVTLRAAGLLEAQVLVVALDDAAACLKLVKLAHRARPGLHIIARAYDRAQVFELYNAGADDIVRETFDSSLRAGRYVLENLGLSDYEADTAAKTFYQHDREAMKDLAQLWDPKVPARANAPYIARAQALEKQLETALMNSLESSKSTPPPADKVPKTEVAPSRPDTTVLKNV